MFKNSSSSSWLPLKLHEYIHKYTIKTNNGKTRNRRKMFKVNNKVTKMLLMGPFLHSALVFLVLNTESFDGFTFCYITTIL